MVAMRQRMFHSEILKRVLSTILLISYAIYMYYQGPALLILTILAIQATCFNEIINVAYKANQNFPGKQNFKSIAWYVWIATNYFLYCEHIAEHFKAFIQNIQIIDLLVSYHRFLTFCLYLFGLLWLIFKSVRRHEKNQFKFLAFVHVLMIFIVLPAYILADNIFNGMIWLLMASILVTANDIFAYIFGKLFGRTPLIEVSPKKTWEGFIGAAIGTILFGFLTSHFFCKIDYLICPIQYVQTQNGILMNTNCSRSYIFIPKEYSISIFGNIAINFITFPFVLHSLAISLFASIIGPFGGFFASGFKRAVNVKHFGNVIPGHGGIMDRFDCFYLMVIFISVYSNAFIKTQSVDKIYEKFLYMNEKNQLQFFNLLEKSLDSRLMLESS